MAHKKSKSARLEASLEVDYRSEFELLIYFLRSLRLSTRKI